VGGQGPRGYHPRRLERWGALTDVRRVQHECLLCKRLDIIQLGSKCFWGEFNLSEDLSNQWSSEVSCGVMRHCGCAAIRVAIKNMTATLSDGLES
jgi:hypothetical protein